MFKCQLGVASRVPAFPTLSSKAARRSACHHSEPHIWTTPASIWSSVAIYTLCTESLTQNTCAQIPFVSPSYLSIFPLPKVEGEKKRERVEQMASKWLKPPTMAPTTSSLSFSSHSPSFADYFFFLFFLPPPLPSTRFSHRCLFNAIPAHNLCQRGSGSLEAPWSEHKVSQEEKERREAGKGGRTGRRRKVEESAGVSGAILSPSQINCIAKKKKKMIRKKNAKNCKTWNRSPRAQTWNPNRSRTSPLFPNSFPHTLLLSFLLSLHLISSLPLQHSPSSPFSSSVPARSARCQSRKWDS